MQDTSSRQETALKEQKADSRSKTHTQEERLAAARTRDAFIAEAASKVNTRLRVTKSAPHFFQHFWEYVGSQSAVFEAVLIAGAATGAVSRQGNAAEVDQLLTQALARGWLEPQ